MKPFGEAAAIQAVAPEKSYLRYLLEDENIELTAEEAVIKEFDDGAGGKASFSLEEWNKIKDIYEANKAIFEAFYKKNESYLPKYQEKYGQKPVAGDENKKLNEFASASGLSPANWIRVKIFTGKLPAVKMSPIDASVYLELKKIGVNLNQVTHKINAGEFPKEYIERQLELANLLKKIINLLTYDRQSDQRERV